jgi:hypothetical protein
MFKGTVSRYFSTSVFFHQTTSSGPNGHAQKRFQIFLNICGAVRIRDGPAGDEYTWKSISIPEVRQFFQT